MKQFLNMLEGEEDKKKSKKISGLMDLFNGNKEDREIEDEENKTELPKESVGDMKKKALDSIEGIEIKEIKIMKPKKKKDDDDIADLPIPVTGSF